MTKRAQDTKTKPVKNGYDKGEPYLRGAWWQSASQRFQIRTYHLWFCCPECAFTMSLEKYKILRDGGVVPTVICPTKSCKFQEDIVLNAFVRRLGEYHV